MSSAHLMNKKTFHIHIFSTFTYIPSPENKNV